MQHFHHNHRFNTEKTPMEQLLADYYGPALEDLPLPASSWHHLQHRLGPQKPARQPRRAGYARVPLHVHEACARIAIEAGLPYRPSLLRYTVKKHVRQPSISVSHLSKHHLRLTLPARSTCTQGSAELDVLLATGLARYLLTRRGHYPLFRLAFFLIGLLGLILLSLSIPLRIPAIGLPVGLVTCCGSAVLLVHQHYRMALVADARLSVWLGRSRVCEGLHSLAQYTAYRRTYRRWDEPSLAERIARNCGSSIVLRDERLTLVR